MKKNIDKRKMSLKLVEIDWMTGGTKDYPLWVWSHEGEWTKEEFKVKIKWLRENIDGRYHYRIVKEGDEKPKSPYFHNHDICCNYHVP